MGRTWPTFNDQLDRELQTWKPFRDALRTEDRAAFDKIFAYAKRHMAEGQNACRPIPLETILICSLIELAKELDKLQADVKPAKGPG